MTGRQRTLAAIGGEPHDRVPVAQHHFTFCARQAGLTMAEYRSNPVRAARALADAAERFDYDCIIIDKVYFDAKSKYEVGSPQIVEILHSPHYADQAPLYADERLRPVPWSEAEARTQAGGRSPDPTSTPD